MQELALSAAVALSGCANAAVLCCGTDGSDGPAGDVTGAVVDGGTLQRGRDCGVDAAAFLNDNDSFTYFSKLDDSDVARDGEPCLVKTVRVTQWVVGLPGVGCSRVHAARSPPSPCTVTPCRRLQCCCTVVGGSVHWVARPVLFRRFGVVVLPVDPCASGWRLPSPSRGVCCRVRCACVVRVFPHCHVGALPMKPHSHYDRISLS